MIVKEMAFKALTSFATLLIGAALLAGLGGARAESLQVLVHERAPYYVLAGSDSVAGLVGSEQILFATDYPLIQHQRLLAQVHENILEPAALKNILGENARRMLGRPNLPDFNASASG